MPEFELSLLGGFELRRKSGEVVRLPTRKAEALLAYLALVRESAHARDSLSELLWGEASSQGARASLRQTLSLLGKALGPSVLDADPRTVAVASGALEVDALELDRLAAAADGASLERAAELYRGDFLRGLAITELSFEEWLLGERERLRETAIDVLARLVVHHRDAGALDRAVQAALRLVAMDPMEEKAHRALMRLYADQGRRAAALRQYQMCVSVLQRELGTEPAAETRALYNEVLRRREARGEPGARPAAPELPVHDTALVGRAAELATATHCLEGMRAGEAHVLFLVGEAGIGKTRLAQEVVAQAAAAGIRVLSGRCYESQQLFPFAPWVEMLRAAGIAGHPEIVQALEPASREALARLMPEVSAQSEPGDEAGDRTMGTGRGRLMEAIIQVVERLASSEPVVLVLEDLHWADEMSLRLLAVLGRRIRGWQVLLVGTAREEELAGVPFLKRARQELAEDERFAEVRLAPLSRADTGELVRALARAGADAGAMERLAEQAWQTSEGNPFVVIESVRAAGPGKPAPSALPGRVRELIASHVERLSPSAAKLLSVAAVAGREFDFDLLQRAAGQPAPEASEALEELVRRQLLHAVGERFDFVHDRIRRAVDESLLAPARRNLHVAIAEALEALHAADPAQAYDRLAYHYSRTDRSDKAVAYLARFAERAARAGAHEQALPAIDEALAHLGRAPQDAAAARNRFDLVFRKTRSLLLLGRLKEVVELLLPEQAFVEAAADPRMAGPFYLRLGATFNYMGNRDAAASHASRALEQATLCGDTATMGKAHSVLSNVNFWAAPEEGVRNGEEAVRLLSGTNERWWLGQSYWILGLNLSYRGRFEEALRAEEEARRLAEAIGDRRLACTAAWGSGFVCTLTGDWNAALAHCRRGVDIAPDPLSRMTAAGMLALAHVERGEAQEAIALLDEAIPQAERFRFAPLHGLYLGFRGHAALLRGDARSAMEYARRGAEITKKANYQYALGWTQRIQARIAAALGDAAGSAAHFREAAETFERMGAPFETERTRAEAGAAKPG